MNNWKEYPHLFANGKFKIKYDLYGNLFEFIGVSRNKYSHEKVLLCYNYSGQIIERKIDRSTLIARPISDMSDEEVYEMTQSDPNNARDYLKEGTLNGGILSGRYLLHLLTIGVYPFDQSHFKHGTVIDSTTL